MKETELAAQIIPWLKEQHYEVYQEVPLPYNWGDIDILAVRGIVTWAIEVKTSFSFHVIEQASSRPTLYRSVFVPSSKRRQNSGSRIYDVCRSYFRIGVIELFGFGIKVEEDAPLIRNHYDASRRLLNFITDEHKTHLAAGTQAGQRLTPYRITMNAVQTHIKRHPGCTIKEIHEMLGKGHYASNQSFKQSVASALNSFEKEWCLVDKTQTPTKYFVRNGV